MVEENYIVQWLVNYGSLFNFQETDRSSSFTGDAFAPKRFVQFDKRRVPPMHNRRKVFRRKVFWLNFSTLYLLYNNQNWRIKLFTPLGNPFPKERLRKASHFWWVRNLCLHVGAEKSVINLQLGVRGRTNPFGSWRIFCLFSTLILNETMRIGIK